MTSASFDKIVAVKLGGEWVPVASVDGARECLRHIWPDKSGPSYRRAISTCDAFLSGEQSMLAVQASFIVAAMEIGAAVELYHDQFEFLDDQISAVARETAYPSSDDVPGQSGSD